MSATMSRADRRQASRHIAKESTKYPNHLVLIPESEYATHPLSGMKSAWRSRDYMVQLYASKHPGVFARMSVNRVEIDGKGGWRQDIPWEDLQRMKRELGFGGFDALEVYPTDKDVVNVANMRHIWIMDSPVEFAWRKS